MSEEDVAPDGEAEEEHHHEGHAEEDEHGALVAQDVARFLDHEGEECSHLPATV